MKSKLNLPGAVLLLLLVSAATFAQNSLLSTKALRELISRDKNLLIMDLRSDGDYSGGHIPGAINVNRRDFENKELPYGGMMSTRENTEKLLSSLGVLPDSHIILYDKGSDQNATRMWFVLKTYGHQAVSMLDGGFEKWENDAMPVSAEKASIKVTNYKFPAHKTKEVYATMDEVKKAVGSKNVIILDVRSKGEFNSGHIPGAVNLDWSENLDKSDIFKSREALQEQFNTLGITPEKKIITYCRSGMRASHTGYVLSEILGLSNVQIFDGSWIEWSHFNGDVEK